MSNPSPADPQTQPPTDFELDLLKQEYFFLQTTIEDYNKQIWVIKALGITGTGAVLALMLQQKTNASAIALIGCAIPLFFWILESQWKHFQRGFYPRVAEIESILSDRCGLCSPKIYTGWSHHFKRIPSPTPKHRGYLWDGLLNRSVFVSYVLEIAFLLLMAAIAPRIWK
jgi:hypothetical protein